MQEIFLSILLRRNNFLQKTMMIPSMLQYIACSQGHGKCDKVAVANWQWVSDKHGSRRYGWVDEDWGEEGFEVSRFETRCRSHQQGLGMGFMLSNRLLGVWERREH